MKRGPKIFFVRLDLLSRRPSRPKRLILRDATPKTEKEENAHPSKPLSHDRRSTLLMPMIVSSDPRRAAAMLREYEGRLHPQSEMTLRALAFGAAIQSQPKRKWCDPY